MTWSFPRDLDSKDHCHTRDLGFNIGILEGPETSRPYHFTYYKGGKNDSDGKQKI